MKPLVSVIVPVYNVELYVRKCLDSLIHQSFKNYEIIIVNDGSTDKSSEVLEEYSSQYDQIILINQENQGLGGARNTGIEAAKGDYILFVDSDDLIHLDTLKLLYREANLKNADIVFCGFSVISETGDIIQEEIGFEKKEVTLRQNPELIMNSPIACNKLIKKELFFNTGIRFPTREWYEDLRTIPKLYLHANTFAFVDKPLYYYLKRKGSITNTIQVNRLGEIVDAVEDLLNYFNEKGAYQQYQKELEFVAVYHAFYLGSVRVVQINYKHPLLIYLKKYIENKVPNYMQQPYLYRLGFKRRIVLHLLYRQHYLIIFILLKLRGM